MSCLIDVSDWRFVLHEETVNLLIQFRPHSFTLLCADTCAHLTRIYRGLSLLLSAGSSLLIFSKSIHDNNPISLLLEEPACQLRELKI